MCPVPYMGSKRKSAQKIYQTIINFNPKPGTLVDLFCGGFSISEKFLRNGWRIIANDKNIYVVELLRKTILEGLPEDIVTKFVTRKEFFDVLKNPDNYEKWYVGFVQCVWSFGNNQRCYLFGKDIEQIKHAGHKLVIDKDPTEIQKLMPDIPQKYIDGILKQSDWHKRRIALVMVAGKLKTRILELQQLQQLERLERLEQLQQLEQLQFYSGKYQDVKIPKGAIIYCDPPYKGTAEYKEGSFNHAEFWEWCRKISKTNKIYISEYSSPEDFIPLLSYSQKSTLRGGQQRHDNQPRENIFVPVNQEKYKQSTINAQAQNR